MNKKRENIVLNSQDERVDDLCIDDLKIIQNTKYFCFGTDSVLLANFVKNTKKSDVILDLCSGSGVIPIIISAKRKYSKIFGVELQSEMYDIFNRNILLNNLDITAINEDIKNVDNIRKIIIKKSQKSRVNVITVNPPYKPKGDGIINENVIKYIARHEDKCTLEDIFKASSKLLESKGKLYIVHKPERLTDLIEIANKYNLEAKRIRFVQPNLMLKPSIVLIEYVKDGKRECIVENSLIEYDENYKYTKEFMEIYGIEQTNIK